MKRYLRQIKVAGGFVLAFIVISLASDIINYSLEKIPILNNLQTSILDFRITDIGYQYMWEPEGKRADIVLVNFKQTSRDTIGMLLQRLASYQPKVVGINTFFSNPHDKYGDSLLIQGISSNPNIVLQSQPQNFIDGSFKSLRTSDSSFLAINNVTVGHNLLSDYDNLSFLYGVDRSYCIRNYYLAEDVNDKVIYSFALEILRRYDSTTFMQALSYNPSIISNYGEIDINYKTNNSGFVRIDYLDIVKNKINLDFIEDKIVILGYLGIDNNIKNYKNLEDRLITPLNQKIVGDKTPDTYSTVIYANILAMNLDLDFISNVHYGPAYFFWIQFTLSLAFFLFLYWLLKRYRKPQYLRFASYILIVLLGLSENLLYFKFDIYFDTRAYILDLVILPEIINVYFNKLMPFVSTIGFSKSFPFLLRRSNQ